MGFDYTKEDIVDALHKVGVSSGESIFVHSNIGFFGQLKDARSKEDYYLIFKDAIFKVIGQEGTLVVPVFSYSFCEGKIFDKYKTPGVCGLLSEMVRNDPLALRSEDANFSVAAIGKKAEYLTKDAPEHSFGPNSFWERFLKIDGKICNFNFDSGSTLFHYAEKSIGVPYRYDKPFFGIFKADGREEKRGYYHYVYDLTKEDHAPDFTKFHKKANELGLVKIADLGNGQIVLISAKDTFELIKRELKTNPSFLIKGSHV